MTDALDLEATIARVEGIPLAGVARAARRLREAGVLARVGRPGPADAAAVLIAANAASDAEDAAEAFELHRGMQNFAPAADPTALGDSAGERAVLGGLAFVADPALGFGEVLGRLLALAAEGRLRDMLHGLALADIAAGYPPILPSGHPGCDDPGKLQSAARSAVEAGDAAGIAALKRRLRRGLDEMIGLGAVAVLVRFEAPIAAARVQVRRGDEFEDGIGSLPSGGRRLLDVAFGLDLGDPRLRAWGNEICGRVSWARSDFVVVDQRALLAVGEALAGRAPGAAGGPPGGAWRAGGV